MPKCTWLGGLWTALSESFLEAAVDSASPTVPALKRPGHHCFLVNFPYLSSRGQQSNTVPSRETDKPARTPQNDCKQSTQPGDGAGTIYHDKVLLWSLSGVNFIFKSFVRLSKTKSRNTVYWSHEVMRIRVTLWNGFREWTMLCISVGQGLILYLGPLTP